jgi:purine-binding chemotaxis protein CheW
VTTTNTTSKNELHVLFKVAGSEYALPAAEVLHMESFSSATRVPGAPAHVAGVIQSRRRVVPVIDLRARFGLPLVAPTLDSRVIVVQHGERAVGLLVDTAREVLGISPEQLRATPEVIAREAQGFVRSIAQVGQRLVMLIDSRKIIGEGTLHGDDERT